MNRRAPDTRSEETRQKLLAAGLELFAAAGLAGVTTRQLAQKAGVNQAAIPYHFGGKEGVYQAVAEHIVNLARPRLREIMGDIRPALAGDAGPANAARLLEAYMLALARLMLDPRLTAAAFGFLLREQFQPGAAFELLYRELLEPAHALCGELMAALLGDNMGMEAGILLEHAFMGQVTAFVHGRATLRRRLGSVEPDPPAVDRALRALLETFIAGAMTHHESGNPA